MSTETESKNDLRIAYVKRQYGVGGTWRNSQNAPIVDFYLMLTPQKEPINKKCENWVDTEITEEKEKQEMLILFGETAFLTYTAPSIAL